jgi:hypothetical protein
MRIMRSLYLSVCEVVKPELPKLCGAPRGAALIVCIRDIFILNEIQAKTKYIFW